MHEHGDRYITTETVAFFETEEGAQSHISALHHAKQESHTPSGREDLILLAYLMAVVTALIIWALLTDGVM